MKRIRTRGKRRRRSKRGRMKRENSRIMRLIRRPKDRNRTEKVNMEDRSH